MEFKTSNKSNLNSINSYKARAKKAFSNAFGSCISLSLIGVYWLYQINPLYILLFIFNPISITFWVLGIWFLYKHINEKRINSDSMNIRFEPNFFDFFINQHITENIKLKFSFNNKENIIKNQPIEVSKTRLINKKCVSQMPDKQPIKWLKKYNKFTFKSINKLNKILFNDFLNKYQNKLERKIRLTTNLMYVMKGMLHWIWITFIFGAIIICVNRFSSPIVTHAINDYPIDQGSFEISIAITCIILGFLLMFLNNAYLNTINYLFVYYAILRDRAFLDNYMIVTIMTQYDKKFISKLLAHSKKHNL
ncbi:hypothetical protein ACX1NA_02785 [Mycoplasma sp. VS276A1]